MGGDYNPNSHDAVFARMEAKIDQLLEQVADVKPRVDALERFRWYIAGMSVAVAFFAQAALDWFKSQMSSH